MPTAWVAQVGGAGGDWSVPSGTAGSPWNDAGAQAALNTIPQDGDSVDLAAITVVMDAATTVIPPTGKLTALTASAEGKLTVSLTAANKSIQATAITAGSAKGLISVSGTTNTLTIGTLVTAPTTLTGYGSGSAGSAAVYAENTSGAIVINGSVVGGATNGHAIWQHALGTVTINGNLTTPGAGVAFYNDAAAGALTVVGNVTGGATTEAIRLGANLTIITVTGNLTGGTACGAIALSTFTTVIVVTGNVLGGAAGAAGGIGVNAASRLYVTGNLTGGTAANSHAVANAGVFVLTGNITGGAGANAYGLLHTGISVVLISCTSAAGAGGAAISDSTADAKRAPIWVPSAANAVYGVATGYTATGTFTAPNTDGSTPNAALVLDTAHFGAGNAVAGTHSIGSETGSALNIVVTHGDQTTDETILWGGRSSSLKLTTDADVTAIAPMTVTLPFTVALGDVLKVAAKVRPAAAYGTTANQFPILTVDAAASVSAGATSTAPATVTSLAWHTLKATITATSAGTANIILNVPHYASGGFVWLGEVKAYLNGVQYNLAPLSGLWDKAGD